MSHQNTVLLVVGTRPEAVKLAPVALRLRDAAGLRPLLVATGQHPEMADEALAAFGLTADLRLDVPRRRSWSQGALMAQLLPALEAVVAEEAPAAVVVQGDTASALAGALSGFWNRVPVLHVEAGLRTATLAEPFPEEGYRRIITRIATAHLAPTPTAVANLLAEGVDPLTVACTGNTVVDAARICAATHVAPDVPGLAPAGSGPMALLTVHRRESWGEPLRRILGGVRDLLADQPDLQVVVPMHPNPLVHDLVTTELADHPRALLTGPLPYPHLIALLARADVVLTDSGGIQEEAPTFGTPVVVLRDTTERPEAVAAGTAWLVGSDPAAIRHRAGQLLAAGRPDTIAPNPFGDGHAASRIVLALRSVVTGGPWPQPWDPAPPRHPAPRVDGRPPLALVAPLPDPPVTPPEPPTPVEAPVPVEASVAAETAEPVDWTDRLRPARATGTGSPPADAGRPVLSPPTPTTTRHHDDRLGGVVELRRGGQLLRHLPGLVPEPLDRTGHDDPWLWPARQTDGVLWVESAGAPVRVHVPGGSVEVRSGALASRRDAGARTTTITVVRGRAEVRADRGDSLDLGPRQCTTVHDLGTLGGAAQVPPDEMDADPWIVANRQLSHAQPVGGRLATDPLVLLADV